MTFEQRFERDLPQILDDIAMGTYPDYIDGVLGTTATRRQRPRWTFLERWLPMSVITLVPRSTRPVPWRLLGTLAALALVLAIAVVAYVGSQNRLPAPFGLASNGLVAYTQDGDILTVDPGTGERSWITSGNEVDREARWSLDGTRLAFLRGLPLGTPVPRQPAATVVIVDRAGKVVAKSSPIARIDIDAFAWSPDGRSIATGGDSVLSLVDARNGAVTRLEVGYLDLDVYWRPGDRREILFHGMTPGGGRGLVVADVDDPDDVRLLVPESPDEALRPNGWTPDGRRLVYTKLDGSLDILRLHVLDLTTGNDVEIDAAHGHVSNDGSRILALNADGACVVSIDGGPCEQIAPPDRAYSGGFASGAQWAPDDAWILIRETDGQGRAFLLDPNRGMDRTPTWAESGGESWQRRAR